MRRSPRRPLILKRRKLPFQQRDHVTSQENSGSSSAVHLEFPDGVRVLDHPSFPGTQVVVIPKTAKLRNVIEALTVKGKECGTQGPNKFILLGENGSLDSASLPKTHEDAVFPDSTAGQRVSQSADFYAVKHVKEDGGHLNESLTSMQCLERCDVMQQEPDDAFGKENKSEAAMLEGRARMPEAACDSLPKTTEALATPPKEATSEKPPFSYMTMIQFAINSSKDGLMTLKEIYDWLQHHFDFFKDKNRKGWKNSVRHNLSLHKMFVRKTSANKKVSFWSIRPEANRGLTLDQVYTNQPLPVSAKQKTAGLGSTKRMKALLPRTPAYLIPVQVPISSALCLPSSCLLATPTSSIHTASTPCKAKRHKSAPTQVAPMKEESPPAKVPKVEVKEEPAFPSGSSRRKQRLERTRHEEPLLVYSRNSDSEPDLQEGQLRSCESPVKAGRRQACSTPSKPPAESAGRSVLDFSPIHAAGGPACTPLRDYAGLGVGAGATPPEDWALFSDAGAFSADAADRSLGEGLVLDTLNDSLSKILVDLSFGLDELRELGLDDLSLSEIIPQLK